MYRVEVPSEAEREIKAASQYYERKVEGRGIEFLDEVEESFNKITEFPYAWPMYEDEFRRYLR